MYNLICKFQVGAILKFTLNPLVVSAKKHHPTWPQNAQKQVSTSVTTSHPYRRYNAWGISAVTTIIGINFEHSDWKKPMELWMDHWNSFWTKDLEYLQVQADCQGRAWVGSVMHNHSQSQLRRKHHPESPNHWKSLGDPRQLNPQTSNIKNKTTVLWLFRWARKPFFGLGQNIVLGRVFTFSHTHLLNLLGLVEVTVNVPEQSQPDVHTNTH